ncbi:MAG: hypothetical protein Q4E12_08365 [Coriobacteriia bacterium]|nr:hypothetical protein [Coriobacteriia bacterium]
MAKKQGYNESLEDEKHRALVRMGLAGGALVVFGIIYAIAYFAGALNSDTIIIASGASLLIAVLCCSVIGANFNTWNRAKRLQREYEQRVASKKKKRR